MTASRALTLADILDQRAYERRRADERRRVTALRARRRVEVGPVISVAFESRDTIWYQIQEMARAERIATDEGIAEELAAYNPLVPEPGQLRATMFLELTEDAQMREWLPKLVGIERHVVLELPGGEQVRCTVDAQHVSALTRETVTSAVHYLGFDLSAAQRDAFGEGAALVVDHPEYRHRTVLSADAVAELAGDLADDPSCDAR